MIGVNPPGHFLWYGKDIAELEQRYARYCAQDASCSERTDDLVASLRGTSEDMPGRFLFLPVNRSNVARRVVLRSQETTPESAPLNAPDDARLVALGGEGRRERALAAVVRRQPPLPEIVRVGPVRSFGRADDKVARRYFAAGGHDVKSNLGDAQPRSSGAAASWPTRGRPAPDEDEYSRMRPTSVETLMISGELDFSTPPQGATRCCRTSQRPPGDPERVRPLGQLLHAAARGRHAPRQHVLRYGQGRSLAVQAAAGRLHARGDADRARQGLRRRDRRSGAPDGALARADGPPRPQRRAASAARPAPTLRSVYTIVLGLGGWFLGVLVVISTTRGVPVDGELFSALTIGAPIGLGVYLAWVRRDGRLATKAIGFAAAVGGALVGGVARVQRRGRHAGADHDDRRCRRRLEPRPDPARHRVGPAGS